MRLDRIELDRYGPLAGFSHDPTGGLEVLYGPNEAGKTLLLEGVCRLLAPDCGPQFANIDRVEREPVGRVTLQRNGEQEVYDGEDSLVADGPLTARHLRNIFVIRDSDLRLREEHAFYDSVTEQIGDLHTAELDALTADLKTQGRLTDRTLSLSSAAEHDDVATVRDDAAALAADLRSYVQEAREADIEEQERRRIQVQRELRQAREVRARQAIAETRHEHQELAETLSTYEDAVETLANAAVSEDEHERLQRLQRERRDAEREAERIESDLAELREERQSERERRRELESALEGFRARENTVSDVRDQLAAVDGDPVGQGRLLQFLAAIAVASTLGGGIAAGLGAGAVGLGLILLGVLAAGGWLAVHRRQAASERERAAVVAAAQTAALDVEEFSEVRQAVEAFEERRRELDREHEATAERVSHLDEAVAERVSDRDEATERASEAAAEIETILEGADEESVDAYEATVEEYQRLAGERDRAAAVLENRLPPSVDDATPGERIAAWEDALDALADEATAAIEEDPDVDRASVDPATVEPADYDPERLSTVRGRIQELEDEAAALESALDDHETRLEEFEQRMQAIRTTAVADGDLGLPARSLDGLLAAADDLEALVARIERQADVAREAIDVLESVRADEEAKIAALFGEDGRAGAIFDRITDGRYTAVRYDADERTLRVRRADGEWLVPAALSHATAEQLYLAARVSLAEQLLGHEPGFFLLDDAFLPADRDRLASGFEVLSDLAAAGWQLVYLTAKPEVGEEMVEAHDLPVRRLDERG